MALTDPLDREHDRLMNDELQIELWNDTAAQASPVM